MTGFKRENILITAHCESTLVLFNLISLFLFLPAVFSDPGDTAITVRLGGKTSFLSWDSYTTHIPQTNASALHGTLGLELDNRKRTDAGVTQSLPYEKDSWQRLYFRVDSCGFRAGPIVHYHTDGDSFLSSFILIYSTATLEAMTDDVFLLIGHFAVHLRNGSLNLMLRASGPDNRETAIIPVLSGQTYCLETHVVYFTPDSVTLDIFIDGIQKKSWRIHYPYPREYFQIKILSDYAEANIPWRISIDDVEYSDERPYGFPRAARVCSTEITGHHVKMVCQTAASSYHEERILFSQWRVFQDTGQPFPVFDVVQTSPRFWTQQPIPFRLDQGAYWWQNRFKNGFGRWSNWSAFNPFIIPPPENEFIVLKNAYFSAIGRNKPLAMIVAGKWYDFHLVIENKLLWDSILYALAWVHDTSYTFGHLMNKGGKYHSASNYVYNLNMLARKYGLREKIEEGGYASTPAPLDRPGLYLDQSDARLVVDTVRGVIRFRARLLPDAVPGDWRISSCLVFQHGQDSLFQTKEAHSNILNVPIIVVGPKRLVTGKMLVGSVLILLLGFSAFVYMYRRYLNSAVVAEEVLNNDNETNPIFQQISAYIREHLTERIRGQDVRKALHISEKQFYAIMLKENQSFSDLINKIRIEKAKELLAKDNSMNIEEISFAVGYPAANHFATIFKKYVGVSPKEFREKKNGLSLLHK